MYCWIRYTDTGTRRYLLGLWVVFLFGCGVIESMAVLPFMVAWHAWFLARRHVTRTLPMIAVAVAFVTAHFWFAPKQVSGFYAMHLDGSIVTTTLEYWRMAAGSLGNNSVALAIAMAITVALLTFAIRATLRRDWIPLVFLGWAAAPLVPVLPLRDHITGYYATVPLIGVSMLVGYTLVGVRRPTRVVATILLGVYVIGAGMTTWQFSRWWHDRSKGIERLVRAVSDVRGQYPDRVILLEDVGRDMFEGQLYYMPFVPLGIRDVLLAPGSERLVEGLAHPEDYLASAGYASQLAQEHRLVVVRVNGDRVTRVTDAPAPSGEDTAAVPWRIEMNLARSDRYLLDGWYSAEVTGRWMGRHGTLTIHAPASGTAQLHVQGYCPPDALRHGPVHLTVTIDGQASPPVDLRAAGRFAFAFPVPAGSTGRLSMRVDLQLDQTFRPAMDQRDLGLFATSVEVQ
jgi:hypothetical protein